MASVNNKRAAAAAKKKSAKQSAATARSKWEEGREQRRKLKAEKHAKAKAAIKNS